MSNLDSQDIDGLPFIQALQKTADKKWGGILRVMKNSEQIGSVFMRDGQVAWGVSNNQKENFGSFLERIGLIPKEKLSEIAEKYRALGKAKKLGTLLEEEGLITRTKLRECLRAHIRAAIVSMMDDEDVVIEASHGEMIVDTNLLFFLDEVLPGYQLAKDGEEDHSFDPGPEHDRFKAADTGKALDILGHLAMLPGYRFSLLSGTGGRLLALHKADAIPNAEEAAAAAIDWINSSAIDAAIGHFGKLECLTLEHENGLLLAQWAGNDKECFIGCSFDKDCKLGVIKHKVSELIPLIRQFIEESIG